jgi:hypothetical protein
MRRPRHAGPAGHHFHEAQGYLQFRIDSSAAEMPFSEKV